MKSIVVVTVLIALCNSANAACDGTYFTGGLHFGEAARDVSLQASPNVTEELNLTASYTFFGKQYRSVFVCENGVICFEECKDFCKNPTDLKTVSLPLIVAVREDIMLQNYSIPSAYYTERDHDHGCFNENKKQVKEYLQRGFQNLSGFEPTHIFISTWYGFEDDRKFQIVITTGGENDTYALLIYKGMNITEDDRMQTGFSAGYGNKYYPLSKSARGSNIGVPGVYVFRIDEDDIIDPGHVDCGDLPQPANGEVVYTSTSVDSVATYTFSADCNTTIRVCLENGSWSGEEPKCPSIRMDKSGLIEVRYNGEWRSVCDDYWTDEDANVVCRQLGFLGYGASVIRKGRFKDPRDKKYWLDDVKCKGDEKTVFECDHRDVGDHNCGQGERAGVACIDKSDIDIKLDGGMIELIFRDERMSVCANHWTNNDAKVACRQLNPQLYTSGIVLRSKEETSGVKVWMDFVDCRGDEESLFECDYIIVNGNDMPCNMRARVMCM